MYDIYIYIYKYRTVVEMCNLLTTNCKIDNSHALAAVVSVSLSL